MNNFVNYFNKLKSYNILLFTDTFKWQLCAKSDFCYKINSAYIHVSQTKWIYLFNLRWNTFTQTRVAFQLQDSSVIYNPPFFLGGGGQIVLLSVSYLDIHNFDTSVHFKLTCIANLYIYIKNAYTTYISYITSLIV